MIGVGIVQVANTLAKTEIIWENIFWDGTVMKKNWWCKEKFWNRNFRIKLKPRIPYLGKKCQMVASNILAKTEITKKEHILKQWCEKNLSNQAQSKSDFSERMLVKKKTEILDKSSRSKISLKINSASPDWCNRKLLIRWQRQKLCEKAKWCEKSTRMTILEST